jgi:hypothetical protein
MYANGLFIDITAYNHKRGKSKSQNYVEINASTQCENTTAYFTFVTP